MKFIRDIISERAEAKPPLRPQVEPETPVTPTAPVEPRGKDRTMTRLSDGGFLDDDDVFKRLLGEDAAAALTAEETSADHDLLDDTDPMDDHNLFDDLDLSEDHAENDADLEDDLDCVAEPVTPAEPAPPVFDAPAPRSFSEQPSLRPRRLRPGLDSPAADMSQTVADEEDTAPAPSSSMPQADPTFPAMPGRAAQNAPASELPDMVAVPAPASGRSGRGAGRVKTRLLGFGAPEAPIKDPFADAPTTPVDTAPQTTFPVGWLVVVAGPGRGAAFSLHNGVSQIGRGEDQAVRLDFGDTSISRSNHAAIAYDAEQGGFYLGHGGKANMVRLNDRPVLSTEEITNGAMIRIGETSLRFVALCDDSFSWTQDA